ncbi:MAG: hypothetical protein F6K19_11665 [Cyanothece sp. SIO1E1]|nr:hypothetical protein [Cyanothece sp. SIO1E1]
MTNLESHKLMNLDRAELDNWKRRIYQLKRELQANKPQPNIDVAEKSVYGVQLRKRIVTPRAEEA